MSDDIERLLQERSQRGTVRGAEQVWASARDEIDASPLDDRGGRFSGRPLFLVAAAVVAVALGGAVLLRGVQSTSTDAADNGSTGGDDAPVLEVATEQDEGSADADQAESGEADEATGDNGNGADDGSADDGDQPGGTSGDASGGAADGETGTATDAEGGDDDGGATDPVGGADTPSDDPDGNPPAGQGEDAGEGNGDGSGDGGGQDTPDEPADETNQPGPIAANEVETVSIGSWGSLPASDPAPVGRGWSVEVTPAPNNGSSAGVVVRTAEPTRAVDGRLVIEVDFASTPQGRDETTFGEIVVTPRSAPVVEDGFYLNELFTGDPAFGCRLQVDRVAVCNLVGPAGQQVWEINFFTEVGEALPSVIAGNSWPACNSADVDRCLDAFRVELSQSEVRFLVNGEVHLHQTGLPSIPDTFFDRPVHVHLGGTIIRHPGGTETFRWGPLSLG